jgi:hypothetical protein
VSAPKRSYKTEFYLVFEDTAGTLHHGRWSTTRELEPGEVEVLRGQFEQAMAVSGCQLLSVQLVSEMTTVILPTRPKLRLVWGGRASAACLALCSALCLDLLGSLAVWA